MFDFTDLNTVLDDFDASGGDVQTKIPDVDVDPHAVALVLAHGEGERKRTQNLFDNEKQIYRTIF